MEEMFWCECEEFYKAEGYISCAELKELREEEEWS